jgi:hypothetical protein
MNMTGFFIPAIAIIACLLFTATVRRIAGPDPDLPDANIFHLNSCYPLPEQYAESFPPGHGLSSLSGLHPFHWRGGKTCLCCIS